MTALERLKARLLSTMGLDLDFTVDLRSSARSPITDSLHLSGRPHPRDVRALREAGITRVVTCLDESERAATAYLGDHFEHLFFPVRDGMEEDIAASFSDFFEFAERARTGHPAPKLLVHCEVGVSRSAALVTALLMKTEGKTFLTAFRQVQAKRPQVLPNIGFASQLQRLERALHPGAHAAGAESSLARYLHDVCSVPVEVATLQQMLEQHDYDAPRALRAVFGGDIPRVVQGVRR